MTTLSVIIPCYNIVEHVGAMLHSLRRNVFDGVEFLLVDDGSTDGTAEVLADAEDMIPGARVITAKPNRGLSAARNLGLAAATGEYLTYLDGDDFVAAGYFAELLAVIRRLDCDVVRTDHVQVNGRERIIRRVSHGPRGVVLPMREAILPADRPTSVDAPNAWSGIYHRRVADAGLLFFDEELRTCEDRPWCWRLHLGVRRFAVVGLTGLFYRRGVATSLTQVSDERQLDFLPAHDMIIDAVRADRDADRLMPKAIRAYCSIICHHLKLADRHPAALRRQLRERSAAALAGVDPVVLSSVLGRMDADRRRILMDLRAVA